MIRRIGLELHFPGDPSPVDVASLYREGSGHISLRAFNDDKQSVVNTFSFSLRHDQGVVDKVRSATGNITVYAYDPTDSSALFSGIIEPSAQQSSHQVVESLRLEAVDASYLLDEKIAASFEYPATIGAAPYKVCDPSDTAHSIFHQVVLSAGYLPIQIAATIGNTATVQHCAAKAGDETYREFLDGLLFEYGLVVDTDEAGRIITKRWTDTSGTYSDTVDADDLSVVEPCTWERRYIKEDGVSVEWAETAVMDGALLYRDSLPVSSDGEFTGKPIAAGDYYPPDSDIEDVFQDFVERWLDKPYLERSTRLRNRDISLISTDSHEVLFTADDGVAQNAAEYESHRAKVRFRNTAAGTKSIYTFEIRGRALYRAAVRKTVAPDVAAKPREITTRFIFDAAAAGALANSLALDLVYGDFEYSFGLNRYIAPGTTVRLVNLKNNIDTDVLIQECDYDIGRPIYRYRAVALAEYADVPAVTTVSGGQALWPYMQDLQTQVDARPTSTELAAAPPALSALTAVAHRDGVRLTPTIPVATDPSQGATGIILQRSTDSGTTWADILGVTDGVAKVAPGPYDWQFARATDGYPEASGSASPWAPLPAYRFRAKAVNAAGTASADWTYSGAPNVSGYGTWLGGTPTNGRGTSAGRDVKAQVDRPGSTVYGWAGLDVQISKDQSTGYEPQTGLDPFASEDNWRQTATAGAWRRIVDPQFTTSVPLEGQLNGISRATSYYLRFRYVTDRAWSSGSPAGYVDSSGLTAGPWSPWIPVVATQVKEDDIRDTLSNIYASIPGLMAAYSGRSLPDMPDGPAGTTYRQDAWLTVDGWTGLSEATLSTSGGRLIATVLSGRTAWRVHRTFAVGTGKTYRVKLFSTKSGTVGIIANTGSGLVVQAEIPIVAFAETVIDYYIAGNVSEIQFRQANVVPGDYASIDWIYIGTGAYLPGSLRDLTGNGYGMTAYGVTPNGDALVFDGVNDYTETLESHTMPDLFWIHFKATGLAQGSAIQDFLDWSNVNSSTGALLIRRTANSNSLQIVTTTGTTSVTSTVSNFFTSSSVEFSVAVDVLNGKLLITKNGLRVQEFAGLTIAKPTATIIFGRRRGSTNWLSGSLSEIRLINAYPTAAQVLELYQNPASGMPLVIGAERIFGELATIVEGDISVITGGTRDPWNMWVLADYRGRPVERPVGLQRAGDEIVFTRVLPSAAGTLADPKIWHEANGDYIKFTDTGIAIKASLLELDALASKLYSSLEIHKSKAEPGVPLTLSADGVRYGFIGIGSMPTFLRIDHDSPSLTIAGFSSIPAVLNLGLGRTGNASAFIDFFTALGGSVGMRVIRGSGANADNEILTYGTGVLRLSTEDAGPIVLDTTGTERMRISAAGLVSIGTTDAAGETLRVAGSGRLDRLGIGGASESADIMRVYGGARADRLGVGGATETVHATALTGGTLVKDRLMILTDLDDPALQVFPAGRFTKDNAGYSYPLNYITYMSGSDIAAIYRIGDNEKWLVRLSYTPGNFLALVGSALRILNTSTEDVIDLKTINSTTVAVLTRTTGGTLAIKRYSHNGSIWSATGTNLSLSNISGPGAITNLFEELSLVHPLTTPANGRLTRYSVSTTITQVGNSLALPVNSPALAEMDANTDVAFVDSGSKELRLYRFTNLNWAQVGVSLSLGSADLASPRLKHIGSNVVALLDATSKQVRLFRWWRDTWTQISDPESLHGSGDPSPYIGDLASMGQRSLLRSYTFAGYVSVAFCTSRNGIAFD